MNHRYSSRKLSLMGRRRFLNTLASLGISAGALKYMTQDALADVTDNPDDEVPRLSVVRHTNHEQVIQDDAKPEREPVYYTVPKDEWEYVEGVFDGANRINNLTEKRFGTNRVRVGVSTDVNGHHQERVVIVENQKNSSKIPTEELEKKLPDTVNGKAAENAATISDIPVNIREISTELDYYEHEYRPVPSGCYLEGCTIGYRVYHRDLDEYVQTTAGHCVDGESGVDMGQPYSWNTIGESYDAYAQASSTGFDAATIRMPDERVTPDFAANDGSYEGWSI